MYLVVGNSHMESSNYAGAIESFERARAPIRHHTSRPLLVVSLVGFSEGYDYNVSKLRTLFVRYLDGILMILTSRFGSAFVKHFMRRVA